MPLKGIFFDLDGTLVDYDASVEAAFDEAYALVTRYHPKLERAAFRRHFDGTLLVSVVAEQRGESLYLSRLERFRQVLKRMGYPDEVLAQRLQDVYSTVRLTSLVLFSDAAPALDELAPAYHLGLITNGPGAVQRAEIQALDIGRYFRHILVSEEVGYSKPAPEIFWRALETAEIVPEEALFVGDTPETDIVGAQRAGLRTVWLNRSGRPWPNDLLPPDHRISSLSELSELL